MDSETLSSYVKNLPPALWSAERDPAQFLGRALRIFEKVLTGIPDGVALQSGGRTYPPLEETIARLHRVVSPRHTAPEFLPWLATWVAEELRSDLSEAQQRKLLADLAAIYRQRGLKQGLLAYLAVFAISAERPRIVVDAGEALFQGQLLESGELRLHALAHSTNFEAQEMTALLHPSAVAVDSGNRYVVADPGDSRQSRQPAIWRISETGAFEFAQGGPPVPQPLYIRRPGPGAAILTPVAVVADAQGRYGVLDRGPVDAAGRAAIYRLTPPPDPATVVHTLATVIDRATTPRFDVVFPMDMVLDTAGRFVVLDRGVRLSGDPPLGGPARAALALVGENPLALEKHPLDGLPPGDPARVVEPTALVMDSHGRFIVADARDQMSDRPANLVRVDPADGFAQQALLSEENNPLIYPTGLAFVSEHLLLVCDTGLRNGFIDDAGNRAMAEPPALYRVDLSQSPPKVERITAEQKMVYPTKIAVDRRGRVVVADRGETLSTTQERSWRTRPHEFGVVVTFSLQRPAAADPVEASRRRGRIRYTISRIVEQEKPAHTLYWLKS